MEVGRMAGGWLKVEEETPDKPEIAILARRLGVSQGDAFLEWFKLYRWLGRVTGPGLVPNLSLADADMLSGARTGTAPALASAEIGWLRCDSTGIHVEKWDRHNSKSAKARALDQEKKRSQRAKEEELSRSCPSQNGTKVGPEQEVEQEEEPIANTQLANWPLAKKFSRSGFEVDLSGVNWDSVAGTAEAIGGKIRPANETDRRNWLRFAVLAQTAFCEDWLFGGVDAVLRAKRTKRSKQAHLYSVLRSKAEDSGAVNGDYTFAAMLASIEIPKAVWKSSVLEILE